MILFHQGKTSVHIITFNYENLLKIHFLSSRKSDSSPSSIENLKSDAPVEGDHQIVREWTMKINKCEWERIKPRQVERGIFTTRFLKICI